MTIQAGDIILVRGKHPITSRIIRWFTGSEYTHVGVAVNSDWVLEIDINKDLAVRPIMYEDYDAFRYKFSLSDNEISKLQESMIHRAKISKGYDWIRILSYALERFFYKPIVFHQNNKFTCSEIVDNLYKSIGIDLIPDRTDGDVTPAQLAASILLKKVYSYKVASHI